MKSSHLIMILILIEIIDTMDGLFKLMPTVNNMAFMGISCKLSQQLGVKKYLRCTQKCMDSSLTTAEVCGAVRYYKDGHNCTLCHICKDDEQTIFVAFQNSTNIIWTRNKGKYIYLYTSPEVV